MESRPAPCAALWRVGCAAYTVSRPRLSRALLRGVGGSLSSFSKYIASSSSGVAGLEVRRVAGYCRPSLVVRVALATVADASGRMFSTNVLDTPHNSAIARLDRLANSLIANSTHRRLSALVRLCSKLRRTLHGFQTGAKLPQAGEAARVGSHLALVEIAHKPQAQDWRRLAVVIGHKQHNPALRIGVGFRVVATVRPALRRDGGINAVAAFQLPIYRKPIPRPDDGGRDVWIPRKGEPSPVGISEQVGAGGGAGGGGGVGLVRGHGLILS